MPCIQKLMWFPCLFIELEGTSRRYLVHTSAQKITISRPSPGQPWLYLAKTWKPQQMETEQPLWRTFSISSMISTLVMQLSVGYVPLFSVGYNTLVKLSKFKMISNKNKIKVESEGSASISSPYIYTNPSMLRT